MVPSVLETVTIILVIGTISFILGFLAAIYLPIFVAVILTGLIAILWLIWILVSHIIYGPEKDNYD